MKSLLFRFTSIFILLSISSCSDVSVNNEKDQDITDSGVVADEDDGSSAVSDDDALVVTDEDDLPDDEPGCTCDTVEGDEDGDGIPNTVEGCEDIDGDYLPNCKDKDSDADGIADKRECIAQPCPDTDDDGVPDYLDRDSDGDLVSDKVENNMGTNPYVQDTDEDGTKDGAESVSGTDPLDFESRPPDGIYYVLLSRYMNSEEKLLIDLSVNSSKMDIVSMIDVSGSMLSSFDRIKEQFADVINEDIQNDDDLYAFGIVEVPYVMIQPVTMDKEDINASILQLSYPYADYELFFQSIYQTVVGNGFSGKLQFSFPGGGSVIDEQEFLFPQKDCEGKTGSIGGVCMREDAGHLLVLFTDEEIYEIPTKEEAQQLTQYWGEYWSEDTLEIRNMSETLAAMSYNNVKILVVNTGFDCDDDGNNCVVNNDGNESHDYMSQMTGTVDAEGNTYNFHTDDRDGNGIRTKLADAVKSLTEYTEKDITLEFESEDNPNFLEVIKSFRPYSAEPEENIEKMNENTFFSVKDNTEVVFELVLELKGALPVKPGYNTGEFIVKFVSGDQVLGIRVVRFMYYVENGPVF